MQICNGRTAIITGAGAGLGRAYALALASEGANVVVNDIRHEAAQAVVDEIVAGGGSALASSEDITHLATAQRIVDATVDRFGEIHAVINNAGVLRDRMFISLSEEDWDEVMQVHLKGHFCLSNILGKRWRDQSKAGNKLDTRIINTSSGAGLAGSVGQSNYSAAKGGIASLTLVQAAELKRYGVTANALAPSARTAMTLQGMPDMVKAPCDGSFDFWDPANVAATVVWLVSTLSSHVTGCMFELGGGKISLCDGWRPGPMRDKGARWEPTELTGVINQLIAESVPPQNVYGS